ncbi:MAG: hypothetical protein IPK53_01025 [bacterium]|nr:hypothetical protein [bacterium]
MMNLVETDVMNRHLGSLALKRFLGRNLMIGLAISIAVHVIGGPSLYYAWSSLFDRKPEKVPQEKMIALHLSPRVVPPKPELKRLEPAPASRGLRGSKGGGSPGQIAKPSITMRMQPVASLDLPQSDNQAINTEPVPKSLRPDFPNMFVKPVASATEDLFVEVNEPGFAGGAREGPKTYGGPETLEPSMLPTRGVPGGPPGTALKGSFGDEMGVIGAGRGGSGPPPGSGVGGGGEGSGSAAYGVGRGSGPEGVGRAAEGDYSSSVGSGGTGSTGIADGEPPISKTELAGLVGWLKTQNAAFSPVLRAYLGTKDSDLCGVTSYSGWNIFVQFSEVSHQLKIFLTQGAHGILLADSDFRQRSQYFAAGNVTRAEDSITAIEAVRDKPSSQRTDEFYRVFGNWMSSQGFALTQRASR